MTPGEIIGLGALAVLALFIFKAPAAGAAPLPAVLPVPGATAPGGGGSLIVASSNPATTYFGTLINVATHPTATQNALGLRPQQFQSFGDQSDFARLSTNTHACQTGNEAACEAVYEQAPGMACTPQFCDQDPTVYGTGSMVDLGNGQMSYHQPGGIPAVATYGKKVPVGGCVTVGRRWDITGGANAQSNIDAGYCAGLMQGAQV